MSKERGSDGNADDEHTHDVPKPTTAASVTNHPRCFPRAPVRANVVSSAALARVPRQNASSYCWCSTSGHRRPYRYCPEPIRRRRGHARNCRPPGASDADLVYRHPVAVTALLHSIGGYTRHVVVAVGELQEHRTARAQPVCRCPGNVPARHFGVLRENPASQDDRPESRIYGAAPAASLISMQNPRIRA